MSEDYPSTDVTPFSCKLFRATGISCVATMYDEYSADREIRMHRVEVSQFWYDARLEAGCLSEISEIVVPRVSYLKPLLRQRVH